ncbi:MAG: hypothetical protein Q9169_000895 [Polycauliona sp. 2 TL-2023]
MAHSPHTLSPPSETQENPRKRKRSVSESSISQPRLSRLKQSYSTKYHGLLNDTIDDLGVDSSTSVTNNARSTQAGICLWSPYEKRLLSDGIARYGQDSLSAIAALIATKSEPEVHIYVQSLKAASVKQHMYGKKKSLVGIADIPAAMELSEECCASLDQAAESLAILQQRHEEQSEKQKYGDLWKLDQGKARWVERRMGESEEGKLEIRARLPAAELLHLGQFLKLSRNFFMNASDPDRNWRSLSSTCRNRSPGLLHTAFSDFHDIAVSITTRLLQTTLYLAMSRLRAAKSPYYAHQSTVKRCDVQAATKILGMNGSSRHGWVELTRRCKLEVYDQDRRTGKEYTLNHSQVESFLRDKEAPAEAPAEDESTCDYDDSNGGSVSEDDSVASAEHSDNSRRSSSLNETARGYNEPGDKIGKKTDAYLDSIDDQESKKEEARLWKMLGRDPPSILPSKEPIQAEDPGPHRHDKHDLDDWREWVDLKPEWEAYDVQNLGASLESHQLLTQLDESVLPKPAVSSNRSHQVGPKQLSEMDTPSSNDVISSPTDGMSSEDEELSIDTDEGGEVTEDTADDSS